MVALNRSRDGRDLNVIRCGRATKWSIGMPNPKMAALRSSTSIYRDTDATTDGVARASTMAASFLRNWPLSTVSKPLRTAFNLAIGNAIWSCSARNLAKPM